MTIHARLIILAMVALIPMTAKGVCTFSNLTVTREKSGKTVTGSPTLSECDTLPSSVTLDAFNFSSVFNSVQVVYRSGPDSITSNGAAVRAGGVVVQAAIHGTKTLSFRTAGDYTFVGSGVSGGATNTVTIVVRVSPFKVSPEALNIATGGVAPDANVLRASTSLSGQVKFSTSFVRNDGGSSRSSLAINNQADNKQGVVTASPQGSSGVFRVETSTSIFKANLVYVTVPPQELIQVLIGEGQGQSETALRGVGVVVRNRVGNPLFRQNTYSAVIFAPSQFASTGAARFSQASKRSTAQSQSAYDLATKVASEIFDGREHATLGNVLAFGSPNFLPQPQRDQDLRKLQDALNRCPKVSAKSLGFDKRWYPLLGFDDQAVIVDGIARESFVFVRQRNSNDCAVITLRFQ